MNEWIFLLMLEYRSVQAQDDTDAAGRNAGASDAATALNEGRISGTLKRVLRRLVAGDAHERLAVADAMLGNAIQDGLDLDCVCDGRIGELLRCIRWQVCGLISGLPDKEMTAMELGLAHSIGRYKLKFSPDKIDTKIIQAGVVRMAIS